MNQQLIRVLSLVSLTFMGVSGFNSVQANNCKSCFEGYVQALQGCRTRYHALHSVDSRLECEGDAAFARNECLQENGCQY